MKQIMTCSMCFEVKECESFDLYTTGSEGTNLCFQCKMDVVNYIRASRLLAGRSIKLGYQMAKQRGNVDMVP